MNQVQPGEACERTRLYLDSYISNELLIETNHEVLRHLEGCPACAAEAEARSRLRSRLKAAVERQAVPPDLQARIRQRQEPRRRFGWWTSGMLAAAAAVLVTIWLGYPRAGLPALTDRPAQAAYIEKISANVAAVVRVGLRDHVHCAVFRRYPKDPQPAEKMVQELGPEYQGLLPLLQAAAPEGYRCVMAHQCSYAGRRYVHLTLKKGEKVLSLVIARKDAGETMAGMPVVRQVSGIPVYEAKAERYQVAGFETGSYMAYVISEMSRAKNLEVAAVLAPGVSRLLENGA